MFGGSKNGGVSRNHPTVIGEGAVIHGDVKVSGSVQVDGQVHGTLDVDGEVSVGPNGEVHQNALIPPSPVGQQFSRNRPRCGS